MIYISQMLLCGLLVAVLMISPVTADTSTLDPGSAITSYVCGTTLQTRSGALCSQTTVSYSVSSNIPVFVYWMNYTDYQVWSKNMLSTPRYDSVHSCGVSSTTYCPIANFVATDADKVLTIYNSVRNSPSTVQVTINTDPRSASSLGLTVGILAMIIILSICVPCLVFLLLAYFCGWCCYRRNVNQTVFLNMTARPVEPVSLPMVSHSQASSENWSEKV